MNWSKNIPVYRQLVRYVEAGFRALDDVAREEIRSFIAGCQHQNGGFTDRAGHPDLYYSLFGLWLDLATGQNSLLENFRTYIANQKEIKGLGPVEQLALDLIGVELDDKKQTRSVLSLLKTVFGKGKRIDLSYRFFLLTLVIDATAKYKGPYYFVARIFLLFYHPGGNLPCSLVAALAFAKHKVGLGYHKLQQKLLLFYDEGGGFRAFETAPACDMLSTGVALFVLRETGYDLRMITPGSLGFIQENYDGGAVLSGDGDQTHDLEYTFYGLLALGTLTVNENETE